MIDLTSTQLFKVPEQVLVLKANNTKLNNENILLKDILFGIGIGSVLLIAFIILEENSINRRKLKQEEK